MLLNIQKTESLTQLVRLLAAQAGNLVNVTELSNTLGIAAPTVKEYLWYLEKTFILQRVTPFFKNIRKEITKASIYYFVDLGLKNYSVNQFGTAVSVIPPQGFLFQNFVFNSLRDELRVKFSSATIHFWRTQDKAEVDFVINTGLEVIPVEVKYSNLKTLQTSRSFKSFLSKYKPKKAFIVHLGDPHEPVEFEGTKIWVPGTIAVKKGERVQLRLINNVKSDPNQHGFSIPDFGVNVVVARGEPQDVEFVAKKAGIFPTQCQLHPAHVGGELVVLP